LPKYNSIDTIKAKVFFEILKTKNYQLLKPKPREKGLEDVFISIHDDFFIKSDNKEANEYLRLINEIAFLNYKISVLKKDLHFYYYNKTTEQMRLDFIDALQTGYDIIIDKEANFEDEVLRVLTIEIGIIQNDLTQAKIIFEQMTEKSKKTVVEFEDQIVSMENVLDRQIKDGITLAKYIALQKSAKQKLEKQKDGKR